MNLLRPTLFLASLGAALAAGCALVTQPGVKAAPSSPPRADAAALERHVRKLAVDLHPRSVDDDANLQAAADYVAARFRDTGASVDVQTYPVDGKPYRNVIARFGPSDGPPIVVGAHYDSCDDTPGADDNASGVAGLLELARLLSAHPPAGPVELVAYPLEEPPHFRTAAMGSMQHAAALRTAKRDLRFMLSLEMIGYFTDAPASQRFPSRTIGKMYPDRGNFVAVVGRFGDFGLMRRVKARMKGATDLPVESFNAPRGVAGVDFSDHASYWNHGFPALMITDTAFMRNSNYHQLTDTPETLDYARMAKVVEAVYAVVTQ
jgi:Zn-dependent M28 family amino/carboxypeptidase